MKIVELCWRKEKIEDKIKIRLENMFHQVALGPGRGERGCPLSLEKRGGMPSNRGGEKDYRLDTTQPNLANSNS